MLSSYVTATGVKPHGWTLTLKGRALWVCPITIIPGCSARPRHMVSGTTRYWPGGKETLNRPGAYVVKEVISLPLRNEYTRNEA